MEDENIHQHSFVLEAADVIFPTLDEAKMYLEKLILGDLNEQTKVNVCLFDKYFSV
jgi:hypothetical protein